MSSSVVHPDIVNKQRMAQRRPLYVRSAKVNVRVFISDARNTFIQRLAAISHRTKSFLINTTWTDRLDYSDVIMSGMASQITGVFIVCSTVCSGAHQRKASTIRVTGLCEGNAPVTGGFVDSSHKGPVSRKMYQFYDVIKINNYCVVIDTLATKLISLCTRNGNW